MWPFDHTFFTYGWPGPFGYYARALSDNVEAGFVQVTLAFMLGYQAKRMGVQDRVKHWLTRDIHSCVDELQAKVEVVHAKMDHVIEHHPDIPEFKKQV